MRNVINHCFPYGICMFYAFVGNVGLHAIFGPTCSQLKLDWGHVGPTLGRLLPNFVHLKANLGTNKANLLPTWALAKRSDRQLGRTKRHMEPIKGDMEPIWRQLEPTWGQLARILARIWAILDAN